VPVSSVPTADAGAGADLPGAWQDVYNLVDTETRALVVDLAHAHVQEPAVGEEVGGIPIEIAWPEHKVAITFGLSADECDELVAAGWTVCEPDAGAIAAVLQNGEA
jgi:hypothetical protein